MRRIAVIVVVALASLAATAGSALASATTITYHADGTAADVSGTHDGTWFGTPAYAPGSSGAAGDESFSFTGNPNSYIKFDQSVGTFGTDDATISFDIQTATPFHQQLLGARSACANPGQGWWEIGMRGAGEPDPGDLTVEFGGNTYTQAISTTPLNDGRWHHIVIHRDSLGVSLSVDARLEASSAGAPANINPTVPFSINRSPCAGSNVHPVNASIDEISITRGTPDTTPPSLAVSHTVDGQNGWNVSSGVTETVSASDAGSGLAGAPSCTVDGSAASLSAGSQSGTWTFPISGDGTHSVSCSVSDAAGNGNSASDAVEIDTSAPVVSYAGNAGTYTVADSISITCSASDPSPGSGVASDTCQNISGDAYAFSLGTNSYSASATDNAGNVGNGSTAFTVTVDAGSLCTLTQRWVTKSGVAGALCAKLDAAGESIARGDTNSKDGQLGAYRNQLSAQTGKSIPADKAAILSQLSQAI